MATDTTNAELPRGALWGALALLVACLVVIGAVRWSGGTTPLADELASPVVASRALRVADGPDGSVVFYDARSDRVVKEYASGEGSFIRGTLRAIARERRLQGVGADEPVIVVARADGSIWLEDPQVGSRIALRAFGASNEAAFTPMLAAPQDSK